MLLCRQAQSSRFFLSATQLTLLQEPQPSAVILDACFDDVVPLAENLFRGAPDWMKSLVRPVARK